MAIHRSVAMHVVAIVVASLGSLAHARRDQTKAEHLYAMREDRNSNAQQSLQMLLFAFNLAPRSHLLGRGVHPHAQRFPQVTAGSSAGSMAENALEERQQHNPREVTRRSLLGGLAGVTAASILPETALGSDIQPMSKEAVEQKAQKLTPLQRAVALEAFTEEPFTGKTTNGYSYNSMQKGYYVGAISGVPLFSSTTKFNSGSGGWPAFRAPIDEKNIITRPDPEDSKWKWAVEMGEVRTEVLDAVSGAHLGHMVKDHWCINAAALTFVPSK